MPKGSQRKPLAQLPDGDPPRGNQIRLESLCRMVQGCHACPAMEGRRRVLSARNGRAGVNIMFIAEAPGRNGADRTGVPLHGDPSGMFFEQLLLEAGLARGEVFVTNSVLCNPRDENGNNRKPNPTETSNCSHHLAQQVEYVDPRVIVTLGAHPLEALNMIHPHQVSLRNVGQTAMWMMRLLVPMYHPSPRATYHRSKEKMVEDFKRLKNLVQSLASDQH